MYRIFILILLLFSKLYAMHGEFYLSPAYRRDSLSDLNKVFTKKSRFSEDENYFSDLSIFQLGASARLLRGNSMIKGTASYGWIESGNFKEEISSSYFNPLSIKKDHLSGYVDDLSGAVGFLIPLFTSCLRIGPVAGWSYDEQKIRVQKSESFPLQESYHFKWQGPWIGGDLLFDNWGYTLAAGYEYHYVNRYLSTGKGHGQLAYLDFSRNFWNLLKVGFGFNYQIWESHDDPSKDLFAPLTQLAALLGNFVHLDETSEEIKWHSFALKLNIGVVF